MTERTEQEWMDSIDRVFKGHRDEMDAIARFVGRLMDEKQRLHNSEYLRVVRDNDKLRARIKELESDVRAYGLHERLDKAIDEAESGKTKYLGDFTQYVDDEPQEEQA